MARRSLVVLTAWLTVACGGGGSSPAAPTSPAAATVSVSGIVYNTLIGIGSGIANARVEITVGADVGKVTTTDSTGKFTLTDLKTGLVTLRASAATFDPATRDITLTASFTTNFAMAPTEMPLSGRALDVFTNLPVSGVSVSTDGFSETAANALGMFTTPVTHPASLSVLATLHGPTVVERKLYLSLSAPSTDVTMMPSTFDLAGFNEMFRVEKLLRWRTAPPLVVESATLKFAADSATESTATDDRMTPGERDDMIADLVWSLPQLTGTQFTNFASVTFNDSAPGATVSLLRTNVIFVARMEGLRATNVLGVGRWRYQTDGTVVGGAMVMDRDFDRGDLRLRRSVRAHELGHTLGINHVTIRPSVMNPTANGVEPNDADRLASWVAFQRPPGNLSPDTDPPTGQSPAAASGRWGPWIR